MSREFFFHAADDPSLRVGLCLVKTKSTAPVRAEAGCRGRPSRRRRPPSTRPVPHAADRRAGAATSLTPSPGLRRRAHEALPVPLRRAPTLMDAGIILGTGRSAGPVDAVTQAAAEPLATSPQPWQ